MTDPQQTGVDWSSNEMARRIQQRYAADRRFKWYGIGAILIAVAALLWLMGSIVVTGIPGFQQTQMQLTVFFDPAKFDGGVEGRPADEIENIIKRADFGALVRNALRAEFPDIKNRRDVRSLSSLASPGARDVLRERVEQDPSLIGQSVELWVPTSDDVHTLVTGTVPRDLPEDQRRLKDQEIAWVDLLDAGGHIRTTLSTDFFTAGDSREPEIAGIWGAVVGSFFTLIVTLAISFPIGVAAAVYLEEFAAKNRWSDLIEVNINNLAAVPSIVYGLLGLAIFLNVFHLPRSAPLVGGMTLALMTLPTIIIAARAALKAVPPSIRDAATGLGASPVQVTFHHVLPLAVPGILTGTIIGMARALGETAPLLMIGMVAFVADVPGGIFEPATVLPVQIFLWADSPERAFVEKMSAAIIVLLAFLIFMNAAAVLLRKRFERQW